VGIDGTEFQLTHEFMAMMLGVRRSSLTDSLDIREASTLSAPNAASQ